MQIFYPWGKESIGILIDQNILEKLSDLSQQCQSYYIGIEKRRNGSLDEAAPSAEFKEEIFGKLEQISDLIRNQESGNTLILDTPFMKESLFAALVSHTLDFDYRMIQSSLFSGKYEVRGIINDRSGHKIESAGISDLTDSNEPAHTMAMGAFHIASKKAFISAVSQLSELDIVSKTSEVLI
jgi:hypothetical protein